jgi:hypothetical protein
MRWVMQSWERVDFMNRYLAGTLAPRLQLDLVPGLRCAAHFAIVAPKTPETLEDYLRAGRAMQRLWLTSTRLGLGLQPEMTPLIFARYVRAGIPFTKSTSVERLARACSEKFKQLMGAETEQAVFVGRIGESPLPASRSLRLDLKDLIISEMSADEPPEDRVGKRLDLNQ